MTQIVAFVLLFLAGGVAAQERPSTANPLAELKDEVKRVLAEAALPFSEEQERAITLMMEDRRQASEELFGSLMDFRAGPTQGQESDRLRSAIEWLQNEFQSRLQAYLTPEQLAIWSRYRESPRGPEVTSAGTRAQPTARQQSQTQFVRINNNAFTAEDGVYRFRQTGPGVGQAAGVAVSEVIQRGGAGAFHGNAQFLLKDESLNAGRRFAGNKPPYQERQSSFDIGGPIIPGRLSTTFAFSQGEAENVDTIRATLPDGIFALGITRPTLNRSFNLRNTFQLSGAHSISFNAGYAPTHSENQGVGAFTMPDRAWRSSGRNWNLELRQFSTISPQALYETRFNYTDSYSQTTPDTSGLRINVLDAFSSGGAQNRAETRGRTYDFSNLFTRLGESMTIKTGMQGAYRQSRALSENNFLGTFTFSSLEDYRTGRPLNYRVNRGNPLINTNQLELAFFIQDDIKLTPQLTLMYGSRYEIQTNIRDPNNIDFRVGFAYGVGRAAVIRAGAGTFHQRVNINTIEANRRFDGTRQFEIIVDNPSFPDAFQAGSVRNTFPSVRVTDPNLAAPYNIMMMLSYERTFLRNLFFSASYDRGREVHRLRTRNLNAPGDITSGKLRSCSPGQRALTCVRLLPDRGNILNLESTASEQPNSIRVNLRQRFSVFSVAAAYTMTFSWADAQAGGNLTNQNATAGFSQEGLGVDSYNLREDWGRLPAALHTLNTTVNAQLPLGLFLTSTMSTDSGRRYSIFTGRDDNRDTAVIDRPPGAKRNGEVGPAFLKFDFNISKAFFLDRGNGNNGPRTNVNIFANMTNAFNRPNYSPPSGVMTSPNFGKYTSAGDPREFEVGLRFQF